MSLWDRLLGWAEAGAGPAVWVDGRSLTFAELVAAAGGFGRELADGGLPPGGRVVLVAPTSVGSVVAYFGVAAAGGVLAPLNPRMTAPESLALLDRLDPAVVVVSAEAEPAVRDWARQRGRPLRVVGEFSHDSAASPWTGVPVEGGRDWLIQLTSGSTAAPKAVLLSHDQCARMGAAVGARLGLTPGDRYFVCNPIHHVGCTNFGLLAALSRGAGFYSLSRFDPYDAVRALVEQRCTAHHGIDAHYLMELQVPELRAENLAVRVASTGGGHGLPDAIAYRFGAAVVQRYGQSETSGGPICGDWSDPLPSRMGTSGRALPGVEVAITDPATGAPQPAGVPGEILVRGWVVMRGYLDDPAATAGAVDGDGWYHTGDQGLLDAEGYLTFVTRLSDILRVGGENVAASEIEKTLAGHPTIASAHVIGVAHPTLGQVPVAFVSPTAGSRPDTETLVAYCGSRLAPYKVPRTIRVIEADQIPTTSTGKVSKPALHKLHDSLVTAAQS